MLILAHGMVSSTVFSFHHFFFNFVIVPNLSLKEETAVNFFKKRLSTKNEHFCLDVSRQT